MFTRVKTHQAVSQDECSLLNVSYALGRRGGNLNIEVPCPQHGPQTQCSHSNSFSVYYNSKEERCWVMDPPRSLRNDRLPRWESCTALDNVYYSPEAASSFYHYRTRQVLWEILSHLNPSAPPPPLLGSKIKHHTYIFKTFEKVLGCRLGV